MAAINLNIQHPWANHAAVEINDVLELIQIFSLAIADPAQQLQEYFTILCVMAANTTSNKTLSKEIPITPTP